MWQQNIIVKNFAAIGVTLKEAKYVFEYLVKTAKSEETTFDRMHRSLTSNVIIMENNMPSQTVRNTDNFMCQIRSGGNFDYSNDFIH